jgi:phosphatidylethanolamine N-methyltransferase
LFYTLYVFSKALAYVLGTFGGVLVVTSFLRLGVTGTFLGDYFGIYVSSFPLFRIVYIFIETGKLKEKVSGFPFSFSSNPMYDGSTLLFISKALL